jgi:hypothetical protein
VDTDLGAAGGPFATGEGLVDTDLGAAGGPFATGEGLVDTDLGAAGGPFATGEGLVDTDLGAAGGQFATGEGLVDTDLGAAGGQFATTLMKAPYFEAMKSTTKQLVGVLQEGETVRVLQVVVDGKGKTKVQHQYGWTPLMSPNGELVFAMGKRDVGDSGGDAPQSSGDAPQSSGDAPQSSAKEEGRNFYLSELEDKQGKLSELSTAILKLEGKNPDQIIKIFPIQQGIYEAREIMQQLTRELSPGIEINLSRLQDIYVTIGPALEAVDQQIQKLDREISQPAIGGGATQLDSEGGSLVAEQRIDPEDDESYTGEEFVEYYGGTDEWNAANSQPGWRRRNKEFLLRLGGGLVAEHED